MGAYLRMLIYSSPTLKKYQHEIDGILVHFSNKGQRYLTIIDKGNKIELIGNIDCPLSDAAAILNELNSINQAYKYNKLRTEQKYETINHILKQYSQKRIGDI